jgi:hypothetical protein
MDNKYNGWTNWETWLFNLWFGDYWYDYAEENKITDVQQLAEDMRNYLLELQDEQSDKQIGLFQDVISNCIREINYYEVAEKTIDEVSM